MGPTLPEAQFDAALRAVDAEAETAEEKAEMLMEIAMGMQLRPKTPDQLRRAADLYRRALDLAEDTLLRARITARLGTALQAVPDGGTTALKHARDAYEAALPTLQEHGKPAEFAEVEMNSDWSRNRLPAQAQHGCRMPSSRIIARCGPSRAPSIRRNTQSCTTTSPSPICRCRWPMSAPRCVRRLRCSRSRRC